MGKKKQASGISGLVGRKVQVVRDVSSHVTYGTTVAAWIGTDNQVWFLVEPKPGEQPYQGTRNAEEMPLRLFQCQATECRFGWTKVLSENE